MITYNNYKKWLTKQQRQVPTVSIASGWKMWYVWRAFDQKQWTLTSSDLMLGDSIILIWVKTIGNITEAVILHLIWYSLLVPSLIGLNDHSNISWFCDILSCYLTIWHLQFLSKNYFLHLERPLKQAKNK